MISVAIMAHPKREQWIPGLLETIDHDDIQVVWDERNDRWDTGRRALLAHDPKASHHLVVQDDAVVCRDLVAGLTEAVGYAGGHPVALYLSGVRPTSRKVHRAVTYAERARTSWVRMEGPWWGVGIMVPVADIEDAVQFGDTRTDIANYDRKLSRYYGHRKIDCLYTLPSLVDHRNGPANPSLVPGRSSGHSRCAYRFIGEDVSALTIDWRPPARRRT